MIVYEVRSLGVQGLVVEITLIGFWACDAANAAFGLGIADYEP